MRKNETAIKAIVTSLVLSVMGADAAHALDGDYQQAMEIRRFLSVTQAPAREVSLAQGQGEPAAETIVLPVSRGFNQRTTSLCWAYATLSALETIYLVRNPEGPDVELSRRAMQYYTMEDRYRRSIKKVDTYIREGGVVLDAVRLIQSNGIVAFDDYYDTADPYGQADIRTLINNTQGFTNQIVAMVEGMDTVYTAPPTLTHMPRSPTPADANLALVEAEAGALARFVLSLDVWESYTPSSAQSGFHDHPDPDARWENVSWYMPRSEFPDRIKQALKAGFPVVISIRTHALLIYGAEYDGNGSATVYYIKDSYPDYYYPANAGYVHQSLWEMTTVKL